METVIVHFAYWHKQSLERDSHHYLICPENFSPLGAINFHLSQNLASWSLLPDRARQPPPPNTSSPIFFVWSCNSGTSKPTGQCIVAVHTRHQADSYMEPKYPSHIKPTKMWSGPPGSMNEFHGHFCFFGQWWQQAAKRLLSPPISVQFWSTSTSVFSILLYFLKSSGQCRMWSIIHTLQQLKHQQGQDKNMYIIHIFPPGRQAVSTNERLKLWSHGALSEVNGMN